MARFLTGAGAAWAIALLSASGAHAAITVFQNNLAGFNAAAGSPPIAIDFESLSGDLAGTTHNGVTFTSPLQFGTTNTLDVVKASDTFSTSGFGGPTNVLSATSGQYVLSPGGAELVAGPDTRQRDSLQLDFSSPISAFGVDVLFQSLDCCSFVDFALYNGAAQVASGSLNTSGNGDGGVWFMGFVSDSNLTNFNRVVFNDTDDNASNPDANIGYDTLRYSVPAAPGGGVPEPAAWTLMIAGVGLAGAALRRTKRALA